MAPSCCGCGSPSICSSTYYTAISSFTSLSTLMHKLCSTTHVLRCLPILPFPIFFFPIANPILYQARSQNVGGHKCVFNIIRLCCNCARRGTLCFLSVSTRRGTGCCKEEHSPGLATGLYYIISNIKMHFPPKPGDTSQHSKCNDHGLL